MSGISPVSETSCDIQTLLAFCTSDFHLGGELATVRGAVLTFKLQLGTRESMDFSQKGQVAFILK